MRHQDWNELHDIVVSSVSALLASAKLPATYAGCLSHSESQLGEAVSIIGLGGDKLRGSVVLSVPIPLLRLSHPTGGTEIDDLADWLSELSNLLVGQLKGALLMRGLAIETSLPITLSSTDLRVHRFTGQPVVHAFTVDGKTVLVVLEVIAKKDVQLATENDESAALHSGDVVLFE